jgi:hypothetical protein
VPYIIEVQINRRYIKTIKANNFGYSPFGVGTYNIGQLNMKIELITNCEYLFFVVIPDLIRDPGSSNIPGFRISPE